MYRGMAMNRTQELPQESLFEQEELDNMPKVNSTGELYKAFEEFLDEIDSRPAYQSGALKDLFSFQIGNAMKEQGVTKKELAQRLNRSRRHIDRIFSEEIAYTLDNMVRICMALGLQLTINVEKKGETE